MGNRRTKKKNLNIGHLDVVFYFRLLIVLFLDKNYFVKVWGGQEHVSSYSISISISFFLSGKQENKLDPIEFKASVFAHSYRKKFVKKGFKACRRDWVRGEGGNREARKKNKVAFLNFSFVQSHKLYLLVTQLRDRIRYWLFFYSLKKKIFFLPCFIREEEKPLI